MRAQLAGETDLAGFRTEARKLVALQVPPEQVLWQAAGANHADLFERPPPACGLAAVPAVLNAPVATVPASFVRLCEAVVLHSDPGRFALMYKLLWRLVHEAGLRGDPLDADMLQAQRMAQAVRRDMHKMKAFVRFRQVRDAGRQDPWHVAWFEPAHHIVESVGPWFARRFTQMRWAILTPECSLAWDGARLTSGPGAKRADAPPADAGEALWLTYYQSIFNPARLKLKMMQKEMPRKYWPHPPEARLIAPLAAKANERSEAMVRQPASVPARRIPGRSDVLVSGACEDGIHFDVETLQARLD
jgi:DNA polymerase